MEKRKKGGEEEVEGGGRKRIKLNRGRKEGEHGKWRKKTMNLIRNICKKEIIVSVK